MGVNCEIQFDGNPYGTYFAGQVITGKVTLKVDKVKLVKAITLNINGFAETRWRERATRHGKRERHSFYGREDYIASKTFLVGSNLSTQVSIEPGIHVYNFSCQIPMECPSSFEGTWGRVRYMTQVTLVRPWKFDQNYTRCLTVLKVMDLNYNSPLLRVAAHSEAQKTYCCWPCSSDPLLLQVSLPETGFVPGQNIPLSVLVTNDSHIRVEELLVTLVMLVTYHSKPPSRPNSRSEKFVLNTLKGDSVVRNCKKQFSYELRVPPTPPTCFNLCSIIQIAYQIDVEARVKGCHANESVSVPVTIGSVPLTQTVFIQPRGMQTLNVQAFNGADDHQIIAATAPPADAASPWAINDSIPPPNYQEAVYMRTARKSINEDDPPPAQPNTFNLDGSAYKPLYPVFDIPSPTAPESYMADGGFVNPAADMNKNKGTWL
ncbi:arrestin domain-containing protein 3-like [Drosophila tropicalis]|uniref:arrestin domain-containing protein 3-like n=1 Tax=Drosophila tropicalis TaxID=46794 RepID=UPI0035AB8AEA